MACGDSTYILADGADLEAEPGGGAIIYWHPPLRPGALGGTKALLIAIDLLKLGSGASVEVVADSGVDGASWYPIGASQSIAEPGFTAPTNDGPYVEQFTANPAFFANFVRFGLKVSGGSVRLSASIRALKSPAPQTVNASTSVPAAGTTVVVVEQKDTQAFDSGQVYIELGAGVPAASTLQIEVFSAAETQPSATSNGWVRVGSVTLNPTEVSAMVAVDRLGAALQAKAVGGGAWVAAVVRTAVYLRAAH